MIPSLEMQPTFTVDVPMSSDEAVRRIREAIESPELRKYAVVAGNVIDLKIDPADQRFWSPHLSIELSDEDSGSKLFGRFSPRPEVWTLFMAIYAVVIALIFGMAVWGYVQWFLGNTPWALAIPPAGILLIILLHLASRIGQRLSSDQMRTLRDRLDRVLKAAECT